MAAGRIVNPAYSPARDRNSRLVPGALLAVYENGTTTKATIYSDSGLSTPLTNPVAANSSGQFPAIWCDAGTTEDPALYTLAVSGPNGESIGNPAVFDDWQPSLNAESAQLALAEAASQAAQSVYEDMLAIQAEGDDAAAIATRAAKAANLSDLADGAEAFENLTFVAQGADAKPRPASEKARDVVSLLDYIPTAEHAAILADTSTYVATEDLKAALDENPGKAVILPPGTIVLGNVGGLEFAGVRILGDSRYRTIIKPDPAMTPGTAIFYNRDAATGTSAYATISHMRFRLEGANVICIDLSSVTDTIVDQCYFAGTEAGAAQIGTGVRFGSPLDTASYTNNLRDCAFYSLAKGVEYLVGANSNMITGGECIYCAIGVDLAPVGLVDTPRIIGMRFEGGGIGIKEKSDGANFIACRFENNSVADIDFIDNGGGDQSVRPMVIGGYTASSPIALRNLSNAVSPVILSPDMGRYDIEAGTTPKFNHGRNVFAARTTALNPTLPVGVEYCAYAVDTMILRNAVSLEWTNAANTGTVIAMNVDASNRTVIRSFNRATSADADVVVGAGGAVLPLGNAATDIGSAGTRYKDGYFSGNLYALTGALSLESAGGIVYIGGNAILKARKTGWATATGTATRTTFDTASVTLPQLAERVKALLDDLHATAGHGIIGT